MQLHIFFSPKEIAVFLRSHGYQIEPRTFGRWESRYHNESKWVEYTDDAVVIGNKEVKASDLFQLMVEYNLKRVCTTVNAETKTAIEIALKNILE
jgi:hypothetical protein